MAAETFWFAGKWGLHHVAAVYCDLRQTVIVAEGTSLSTITPVAVLAVLAFVASVAIVGGTGALGLIDSPNQRSSHSVPTPRGGGIAITLLTLIGFVVLSVRAHSVPLRAILGYSAAGLLVGAMSFIDDVRSLSASIRLAAQAISAAIVIATCGYVSSIAFGTGFLHLGIAGTALTLFWIVGLTNAYNFMDGIDGIAGGQAVVAGAGWTIIGVFEDEPAFVYAGILIASTSLGFLRYNWPPASIFMGDAGSAFLGFSFAVLPLLERRGTSNFFIPAVLFVWPFVFDATLTLIRRLLRRENVFDAHRSHLYQRLILAGYSHKRISILYITLAMGGAGAAIAFRHATTQLQMVIIVSVVATALGLWRFVLQVERSRSGSLRG